MTSTRPSAGSRSLSGDSDRRMSREWSDKASLEPGTFGYEVAFADLNAVENGGAPSFHLAVFRTVGSAERKKSRERRNSSSEGQLSSRTISTGICFLGARNSALSWSDSAAEKGDASPLAPPLVANFTVQRTLAVV